VKSVFLVRDEAAQAAVLHALNRDYFRATGEVRSRGLTVTVHHNPDETKRVEQIVYGVDKSAQRY
jgi:predicted MPP superfamily phosphohydrolase